MKTFCLIVVLLSLAKWSVGYSAYQGRASAGYTQSSQSQSQHTSSSSSSSQDCCRLSPWGYGHQDEVRQFANRLRQEYNVMSQGSTTTYSNPHNIPWSANVINLTGKTASELDALCRRVSEQLVTDMRKGLLAYTTIASPSFFEWKASESLESYANSAGGEFDAGQQQQQVELGHFQPVDLSNYDEVKNYAYPAEVKVIDGKTYVVHKNCTEASKTTGDGYSPLLTVLKRNRTIINTGGGMPTYNAYDSAASNGFTSSSMVSGGGASAYPVGVYMQPGDGGSRTTITRKKTIYDWVNQNMEPSVMGYSPVMNVDSQWSSNLNTFKPPVMQLPVGGSSDVEIFNTGSHVYRPSYVVPAPGSSTVTLRRYNQTIITNPDGTNTMQGSELNRKWVDGKLVYDSERPFGEWTVPRGEAWKREERERFFWFLTQSNTSVQKLEEWQRQQEDRLLGMAERYHTSVEEIHDWHRKELERYRILLGQYQAQNNKYTGWKRVECGRLDWLIHQNSVTREELERWQRENQDKLAMLARQYRISLEELKSWQIEELNRLYVYFNDQNNSMIAQHPDSGSLHANEQERLEELIRQHNSTISQLHNSIKLDQQKLVDLQQKYRGNVQDMEQWLKSELARLGGIIDEQRNEMTRVTAWQSSERERLENIVKEHRGSVQELEVQMARDRTYIQSLASKYHVSIEELEKWQSAEVERLHNEGHTKLEMDINEWQRREREHLMAIANKNDLTIEEFQTKIMGDRTRLEALAKTYKVQISEVEEWIRNEIKNFQSQGLLKEVETELAQWQQKERDRLLLIVQQNELTVEELEKKIKNDQTHLYSLANTYQVHVEEIEEWLKKELVRLQGEGLIKVEDLKDWQKSERNEILKIVTENKLTIEEFEKRLLADRQRLADLSRTYNVQTSEIETWIKKEGERLQSLGLLQMQEQLNNWQKIERERLLDLVNKNNLSIEELQEKIKTDQSHLYGLAHRHQVRVEEIEEWIKQEIKKLQQQGLIEMEKLKDWQTEWRGNLTNMVKERDFTVEEFHKWLLEDRARLQALAMQHNVQIEEIEQWVRNEEQRFVTMGLLKPNEKLTNWQEVERRYLERITQEQYHSTEQLEQRLRQDRELLEKLARDYSVQVEEIETWMKKELARLRDDGQLQIDNLTSWQIAERARLEELIKQNKQWSVEEFESVLRMDREHMQTMAFKYHTSVEEIEKWIQSEVERLRRQGKLNIEQLTAWQMTEQQRIMDLLQQQSGVTVEEFERKVQHDRFFLNNLATQYHVSVVEVEAYVKKVIEELREKGKFEVENLQNWQIVERDYIKQLIKQYNNGLSTTEYEQKLLNDRAHLTQLADQYRINIDQIEAWMIEELKRLRKDSENHVQQLAAWQVAESKRLKDLIKQNNHLTYVEYEVELMKERARLQDLAKQYSVSVEQIEQWLRQQLVNLKTTGEVQVENLTQWQDSEQKRLIDTLLQQQNNLSLEEFEIQLQNDRTRLQQLSQQYRVSVEQIEHWMRDELQRLKNSGLLQVEQLTYWQKIERDRLQDWLKQQNNETTYEEFSQFLKRDKNRLQRIAQDYHITVEEVETWVQQEGARLHILGHIQAPQSGSYIIEEWEHSENTYIQNLINDKLRKQQKWSIEELERHLVNDRAHLQRLATQYHVTVEQIEAWYKRELQHLLQQQRIVTEELVDWQRREKERLYRIVQRQPGMSLQVIEKQLLHDKTALNTLADQYHVNIEELEMWNRNELTRLSNLGLVQSTETITSDWKAQERQRLRNIAADITITLEETLEFIAVDNSYQQQLANMYGVSLNQLAPYQRVQTNIMQREGLFDNISLLKVEPWQRRERDRIYGLIRAQNFTMKNLRDWQRQDVFLTELAAKYGIAAQTLKDWQIEEYERLMRIAEYYHMNLSQLQDFRAKEILYLQYIMHKQTSTEDERVKIGVSEARRMQTLERKTGLGGEDLLAWRRKIYLLCQGLIPVDFGGYGGHESGIGSTNRTAIPQQVISKDRGDQPPNIHDENVDGNEPGVAGQDPLYPAPSAQMRLSTTQRPTQQYLPPVSEGGIRSGGGGVQSGYSYSKQEYTFTVPTGATSGTATVNSSASAGADTPLLRYGRERDMTPDLLTVVNGQQQQEVDDFGQQQQVELAWNGKLSTHGAHDVDGQQQQQVETGSKWSSSGDRNTHGSSSNLHGGSSYTSSHGSYTGHAGGDHNHNQQQAEDFGQQQQVELDNYRQHELNQQQQVQVENVDGTFASSQKQVDASGTTAATIEVEAEAEPSGFWGKIKKKTSNIFG